ncbi:MAG: HRDC domain-containing protein [Kiritimatiellae bacterium]|nr:HRDC domain-containing protein [Kiritimatiellia bacterium]
MIQFAVFQITEANKVEEQEALNAFLRSHRILTVETAAFPNVSGWGYNVKYMDGASQTVGSRVPRDRIDYMEVLTPDQFRRFYAYRNRRKKISEDDGIAAFEVLTDSQMAELAKMESPTRADMEKIRGVGGKRVAKFADRLLDPFAPEELDVPYKRFQERNADAAAEPSGTAVALRPPQEEDLPL